MSDTDKRFSGYIPKLYETYMVPMLFAPYAEDLANRVASRKLERVLEVAAGTGVLTRALASTLSKDVAIVATDLNQPMIDHGAEVGTARPVEWRQADAMQLPFAAESFDAVVCQFGVMFFPDKARAFAEVRRVLRFGGVFIFNTWDRIEENELADTVTSALASLFPDDPPRFMARVPHGYHDRAGIANDLAGGGFTARPEIVTLALRSRAPSPRHPAIAICQGTPVRNEIEERDASRLEEATNASEAAIARRFGHGEVDAKMQAHVVTVVRKRMSRKAEAHEIYENRVVNDALARLAGRLDVNGLPFSDEELWTLARRFRESLWGRKEKKERLERYKAHLAKIHGADVVANISSVLEKINNEIGYEEK